MGGPTPLRALLPHTPIRTESDWVLKNFEELQACVGISFAGYEEKFKALVAIEAGHSLVLKLASKKGRELKKLECSINYD